MMSAPVLSSSLNSALVIAVEVARTAWVIAAHVPGFSHTTVKQRIEPRGDALLEALERLKRRAGDSPSGSGGAGGRMRKVLIVALARKLLIALWRYAVQGLVPDGSTLKPA